MIVVVDTNIVFSGILSPQGTISDLLLNSQGVFEFFAPSSLIEELDTHYQKLLKLSGLSKEEISFLRRIILKRIESIDLDTIRQSTWKKAFDITRETDPFDTPFVALSLELNAPLWTGDKKLIRGLSKQKIDWIFQTDQIRQIRNDF